MGSGQVKETTLNGRLKGSEVVVVFGVQTLFFDELPKPLNEVEIG